MLELAQTNSLHHHMTSLVPVPLYVFRGLFHIQDSGWEYCKKLLFGLWMMVVRY